MKTKVSFVLTSRSLARRADSCKAPAFLPVGGTAINCNYSSTFLGREEPKALCTRQKQNAVKKIANSLLFAELWDIIKASTLLFSQLSKYLKQLRPTPLLFQIIAHLFLLHFMLAIRKHFGILSKYEVKLGPMYIPNDCM